MIRKLVAFFAACAAVVLLAQPASAVVNPVVISFKNVHSGLCMDVLGSNPNNSAPVVQSACTGANNQKFTLEKRGDNLFALKVKFNGYCLDVPGSTNDNVQVTMFPCHYDRNQLWYIERLTQNTDQFQLRSYYSDKCLENGIRTENGKPIFQFQCHQDLNQRWI